MPEGYYEGQSLAEYLAQNPGTTEADYNYYKVELPKQYAEERGGGKLQQEALQERLGLGITGDPSRIGETFFDPRRGVNVRANQGQYFVEYGGGGIEIRDIGEGGKIPTFEELFAGKTAATPVGANAPGEASTGVEGIKIQGAEGKEVARTGQTLKNPQTGVDVHAKPGHILVEYTDGTFEERPVSALQQPTGTTTPVAQAGSTAEELGITRQTEVKGGAGTEVTRAPYSAAEALAQAKTPEEKDAVLQAEGLTSTTNLEFIGTEYTSQETGERRIAKDGYAFYQEPGTDTILERPIALQSLAKESTSPSVLAERAAAQAGVTAGALPSFTSDISQALSNFGLGADENALIQALRDRPIPNIQELYTQIQTAQGVPTIQAQLKTIQDEMKTLDDKYATDRASIDENPWLSESLRDRKQEALAGKYETQRAQLVNRQQLYQTLLQDARQEAQFIAGTAIQQANIDREFDMSLVQLAFERADKRFENQLALANFELQKEEFAESKRQFEQTFGLNVAQFQQGQYEFGQTFGLQEKQFQEDVRQFGLNYALEQAKLAQPKDLSEFEQLLAVVPEEYREQAIYEKLGITKLVGGEGNKLAADALLAFQALQTAPGKGGAIGAGLQKAIPFLKGPIPGTAAASYLAQLDRAKALLALPNLQYLKGLGAMSDREFATIQNSVGALNPNMSEKAFDAEINRIIGALQNTMQKGASIPQAGQTFMGGKVQSVEQVKGYQSGSKTLPLVSYGASSLSSAERDLFTKESGLNPLAKNPNSSAFGIWQGIQSNRDFYGKQLGINPNTTDFGEQLQMGRAYISNTYGTAERALAFWNATKQKNPYLAPSDLRGKVNTWISKGYVGY